MYIIYGEVNLIMDKPKVSVCCTTFNHSKFLRAALDGFVMQKTNFPFEVIVHDDVSTDGTQDIIREYEKKYPNIIKPIYQTEKQFGVRPFLEEVIYPRFQGEYVAINEGDDYWTDPNKLQKQVDFLDSHPDYSICFHPVRVTFEDKEYEDFIFPNTTNPELFTLQNLLKGNFIQTNSVMYRWRFSKDFSPADMGSVGVIPSDWYLHLLHAQVGKIGFINEVMSVYRRHSEGMWADSIDNQSRLHLKYGFAELRLFVHLEKYFPEYLVLGGHSQTCKFALMLFNTYLQNQKFKEMNKVLEMCPDCLNVLSK